MIRLSIIIRTLNEIENLTRLLAALAQQNCRSEDVEIIIVDNESTDGTRDLALEACDKLVTIPRNAFSFPRSLNAGAEVAEGQILLFTVGHALPLREDWLQLGFSHFASANVAGVYSPVVPLKDCTFAEMLFYWPGFLAAKLKGPHFVKRGGMGVFGATNIMMRQSLWEQHPFDESYGLGGEDGEWADWALRMGYKIMCDSRFAVRHSHRLGFHGLIEQFRYWSRLGKPTKFDRSALNFRRDLNFKD